ncbi:hypothetical protein [Sphingobacterium hungaricum]|uniref:Uncharacterized protein n=1 Tax=Sphingobacterium hungaricum TaxID=2082723 RepID=A0A928YQB8_9SPHI|nr:hypothetical protein [Sphingobacterium hungaricum]MBE8713789.1 hypothetical protein [Sphingobacterium hungaricum]
MKKLILGLGVVSFLFVACNSEKKAEDNKDTTVVVVENQTAPAPAETHSHVAVPTFSSPEVQTLANEYNTFMHSYIDAYKAKDATLLQELAAKNTEWATKAQEAAAKMTPEDAQKWAEWQQQLTTELTASMQ